MPVKHVTTAVNAIVNSHLWIDTGQLPEQVVGDLVDALTLDNQEYVNAKERKLANWQDMDPYVEMFDWEGDWLVCPRGFASQLIEGMSASGIIVHWTDERNRLPGHGFSLGKKIPARPYQEKIIDAVLMAEQGIVKAPTGSGKTVAALEIVRRVKGRALVIVNTKEIADQWVQRTSDWLGEAYPTGFIGDGEFEIGDGLTVAIQATLWSRRQVLYEDNFFKRFQCVILDECHHATADTYRAIVDQFWARYRFGMSATPEKTGDFNLARTVLGPVIVEVTTDEVGDKIIKPTVEIISTDFWAEYHGDKVMPNGYIRRNNYATVLKKLTEDPERNRLVATEIMERHRQNVNLVLSKRLKHLAAIKAALIKEGYPADDIFELTGKESREERRAVVDRTERGSCVVLSTLADEALDAPRLDRLHLAFPTRNADLVTQQIGRIRRRHPEKRDAKVLDYRDPGVGPLERQYLERRHNVYGPSGFRVEKRK
jgi:superfamily II DNA or RNA helicase